MAWTPSRRLGGEFRVGAWRVRPGEGRITGPGGDRRLRPMLMDLLVLLVERGGQVVSKDAILDQLRGSRSVGESVLSSDIAELRRLLGDSCARSQYIETVAKRGYRFVAPVEPGRQVAAAGVAVLIFENLNQDPEIDYLAEGVSDALITELGNITSLRVISRQSVLRYKGTTKSLPDIAPSRVRESRRRPAACWTR